MDKTKLEHATCRKNTPPTKFAAVENQNKCPLKGQLVVYQAVTVTAESTETYVGPTRPQSLINKKLYEA